MNFSDFKTSKNLLTKEQMKKITGGGTCGYRVRIYDEVSQESWIEVRCGVSKSSALGMATVYEGNWCCDSCGSSSYCS